MLMTIEDFKLFTNLVSRVISTPESEIKKRAEAHRKVVSKDPHKRGPKPKRRASRPSCEKDWLIVMRVHAYPHLAACPIQDSRLPAWGNEGYAFAAFAGVVNR